ncbi:MAG: hypothetical protein HY329_01225 [Chloroflexi bacterium]|nr:hypothetical protein [Chloroflexota bacterium]
MTRIIYEGGQRPTEIVEVVMHERRGGLGAGAILAVVAIVLIAAATLLVVFGRDMLSGFGLARPSAPSITVNPPAPNITINPPAPNITINPPPAANPPASSAPPAANPPASGAPTGPPAGSGLPYTPR